MSGDTAHEGEHRNPSTHTDGGDWSWLNGAVILMFAVLTLVGMALASGWIDAGFAISEPADSNGTTIPSYVYLYAGLGALGYIFTKLMVQFESYAEWRKLDELVEMGLRIPAAWILATGVYLFLGQLAGQTGSATGTFAAGIAFLVGLYVNVALKLLGNLADRMLGTTARASGESEEAS